MTDMPDDTTVDEATKAADSAALNGDVPGRDGGPVDPDDMRAAEGLQASPETAAAYEDLLERGKNQEGEGRIS